MKDKDFYSEDYVPRWLLKLPAVLMWIAIALAVILVMGTAVAFTAGRSRVGEEYRKADPEPQKVINMAKKSSDKVSTYTEMGQIRIITKAPQGKTQGTVLVVSPWFSYPEGDTVFFEELSQKDRQLKGIIANYFAEHTEDELRSTGELEVKKELKDLLNQELVLGKIKDVYFEEYLFFE